MPLGWLVAVGVYMLGGQGGVSGPSSESIFRIICLISSKIAPPLGALAIYAEFVTNLLTVLTTHTKLAKRKW